MKHLHANAVILHPGDLYFGRGHSQVQTLLGSCVAVTLWHPEIRLGGMCHFVLPTRGMASGLDGRYGDEAVSFLVRRVEEEGTAPEEYRVGIFGGGDMFPHVPFKGPRVGEQNVAIARRLAQQCGFRVHLHDVGAASYRQVILNLLDGTVRVRKTSVEAA
jgi:chemotaxis protein CheD